MAKEYKQASSRGKKGSRRTWALMILVAFITAIAIWLVPVNEEREQLSLPALPSGTDAPEALPIPGSEVSEALPLPPPPGGIATVTNGGDGARTFIYELRAGGAQPDTDVVFAEAERLQGEGNLEDAYLLYRFAARHGQAQAALILGTQADPAFHATTTSYLPEPESAQAYKWYSTAAAAGNKTASARMQDLHKRVQQDATAGDEQAQRLLLQWK